MIITSATIARYDRYADAIHLITNQVQDLMHRQAVMLELLQHYKELAEEAGRNLEDVQPTFEIATWKQSKDIADSSLLALEALEACK